jgi:hypothetical protein
MPKLLLFSHPCTTKYLTCWVYHFSSPKGLEASFEKPLRIRVHVWIWLQLARLWKHRAIQSVHDDRALLVGNKYWKLWTEASARRRRTNAGLGRTFSPEITLHIPYAFPMTIEPDSKNKWPTCVLAVIHSMALLRLFIFLSHLFLAKCLPPIHHMDSK